jgi:alpha-N-arabinofuranosidase
MDTLAGYRMDGYSAHYYSNGDLAPLEFTPQAMYTQFRSFPRVEQTIIQQRALLDSYDPQRRIGLFLDEWGVWDRLPAEDERRNGRLWEQQTMRSAVGAALGLNVFNRQADKLYMCNIAQMVNVLHAVLLTDGPGGANCVRTTSYYAFLLFKPHRSKTAVRVESETDPLAGAFAGAAKGKQPEPLPDLSISASRQGSQMVVTLVNPRHDVDMDVDCAIRGATARQGTAQILNDSNINAYNSFDNPSRVAIRSHQVAASGDRLRVTLPAMSVVTALLEVTT